MKCVCKGSAETCDEWVLSSVTKSMMFFTAMEKLKYHEPTGGGNAARGQADKQGEVP